MPRGHWFAGAFLSENARTLEALERFDEAEAELLEAHKIFALGLDPAHERTVDVFKQLVEL